MTKGLELQDVLAHHIKLSSFKNVVVVDTVIGPKGWVVQCWVRDGDDRAREELRRLLKRLDLPFDEGEGSKRFFLNQRFNYAEDLGRIASEVRKVVCKLATSDGAS